MCTERESVKRRGDGAHRMALLPIGGPRLQERSHVHVGLRAALSTEMKTKSRFSVTERQHVGLLLRKEAVLAAGLGWGGLVQLLPMPGPAARGAVSAQVGLPLPGSLQDVLTGVPVLEGHEVC